MGLLKRKEDPDVVRITAAPHNPTQDIDKRTGRYLMSMSIRMGCFVAALFTVSIPWLCATLILASFFLPFIAVVVANSAAPRIAQDLEGPGVSPFDDYQQILPPEDRTR